MYSFYSSEAMGPLRGFANDMEALDAKERAQRLQMAGDFERALRHMLLSVLLREGSHTLCLSLSELAELYLDMRRFDDVLNTTQRMMEEAHRYDREQQLRIAREINEHVAREK